MEEERLSVAPLEPTFTGFIGSTMDALVLFEACLRGRLSHIPRRPHDRERASLIKSGHVFIYEEHSSGIKRWTDGVSWSPSRILGNFLLYRELDRPFQPGEKKRAMKKRTDGVSKPAATTGANSYNFNTLAAASSEANLLNNSNGSNAMHVREAERALIGSLVDSYQFKPGGLIKKTISVQYHGVQHHLVSYYSIEDALTGRLISPSADPLLREISPRHELITNAGFRTPVEDQNYLLGDARFDAIYTVQPGGNSYAVANGFNPRTMSAPDLPSFSHGWSATHSYAPNGNYALSADMHPVSYGQQTADTYAYDQNGTPVYRMPPVPQTPQSFDPSTVTQHGRRSSALAGPTEGNHAGYVALSMTDRSMSLETPTTNGYSGTSHGLPHAGLNKDSMFESSEAPQAPAHGSNAYGSEATHQQDEAYVDGSGQKYRDPNLDDALEPLSYHPTAAHHHQISGFGPLSGPAAVFASAGHHTPPSGVPLGLENTESSSPPLPEHITPQWPTTLTGNSQY